MRPSYKVNVLAIFFVASRALGQAGPFSVAIYSSTEAHVYGATRRGCYTDGMLQGVLQGGLLHGG